LPDENTLPSKAEIFRYWKDRFPEIGIFVDWGEPACWACGFHYGARYDVRSPDASWEEILECWERMPLQRCHIVPRSLGGPDEPSNLFLMCRECHDLAPNSVVPEVFFAWARKQGTWRREMDKIEDALRVFDVPADKQQEVLEIVCSPAFRAWIEGKVGQHWPQSNYATASSRLTPATIIGLAVHYWKRGRAAGELDGPLPGSG